MKKVFFDTSILSEIAWVRYGNSAEDVYRKWELFLLQMNNMYPGFSEKYFIWIASSAVYLEFIGLGSIRNDTKIKCSIFEKKQFKPLKSLVIANEWKQYSNSEEFVQKIIDRIDLFIKNELSARNIYRQTLRFMKNFHAHDNSHFIMADIKRWAKNIRKDTEFYDRFREDILWDSLFRYPYMMIINTIPEKYWLKYMPFWGEVMGILCREYFAKYKMDQSFECSLLGLFAEIDRVGSAYNKNSKMRGFNEILRRWDDMADADAIHYALIGKRVTAGINESVIVITGDKKEDIKRRLECLYKNMQEMAAKGLSINYCPGTIISFSIEKMVLNDKPIDVQAFINKLNSTKVSPLVKDQIADKSKATDL